MGKLHLVIKYRSDLMDRLQVKHTDKHMKARVINT